jgi:O-antigen/teichoic acid export membrane protein
MDRLFKSNLAHVWLANERLPLMSKEIGMLRGLRKKMSGTAADAFVGTAASGVGLLVSLVSFGLFARGLGPVDYGRIGAAYGLVGLAASLSSLPIYQTAIAAGARLVAEARSLRSIGSASIAIATLASVALARLSLSAQSFVFTAVIIGVEVIVTGLSTIELGLINSTCGYRPVAIIRVVHALARGGLLVGVALIGSISLLSFALLQASSSAVLLVISVVYRRHRHLPTIRHGAVQRKQIGVVGRFAAALGVLSVQNDYDKVALAQFSFDRDLGIYTAAYRVVAIFGVPVEQLIAASFAKQVHLAEIDPDHLVRFSKRSLTIALTYSACVLGGFLVFGHLILRPLGSQYSATFGMILALTGVVAIRATGGIVSDMLIALGQQAKVLKAITISGVITVATYYATIPFFGWKGAVAGTYVGETVTAVLVAIAARHAIRSIAQASQ